MPERTFDRLRKVPEGRALLVNMYEYLNDQSDPKAKLIELGRLRAFFQMLAKAPVVDDVLHAACQLVWNGDIQYQRQGAPLKGDSHHVVVFRLLSQIRRLVDTQASADNRIASLHNVCYPTASYHDFLDNNGQALAAALNEMSDDVPFFLSLLSEGRRDHRPIWYTRRSDCEEIHSCFHDGIIANSAAPSFVEWLGFGDTFVDMPVFAFCARAKAPLKLARPSAYDAIDMKWFKYRRYGVYGDDWGRALHIGKYNAGTYDDLDGAPEAVGPSLKMPGLFECKYLGKILNNSKNWSEDLVTTLSRPRQPDEIIDLLCDMLWPRPAPPNQSQKGLELL